MKKNQLNQYLDQQESRLSEQHQARLKDMTALAMQASVPAPVHLISLWWKPVVTGFALLLIVLCLPIQAPSPKVESRQLLTQLPAWVKDTDTSLDLLENMEFYVWMAKQHPKEQNTSRLDIMLFDESGTRQRYTASDITSGLSGNLALAGRF